jgi:hypothetical protein
MSIAKVPAALSTLLLVLGACSDDTKPGSDASAPDRAVSQDRAGTGQEASQPADQPRPLEKGPPAPDKAIGDTGGVKDKGPPTEQGAAKPNSGAACTPPQNVCPHKQDECITVAGGNQKQGMCLIKCTTKNADCPTADPKQKSICFLDFTGPPAAIYCAYVCKYQGQTYPCPTGSTCHSIGTNMSVCVQQ